MQSGKPVNIPVVSAEALQEAQSGSNCSGKELIALMVLGNSMMPEFLEGEILVIETGRPTEEGDFVIAEVEPEDFIFRQLKRAADGSWLLHALNPIYPPTPIKGLDIIKGVVTHKRHPRSRKTVKFYVAQAEH